MKNTLTTILLVALAYATHAQTPVLEWAARYNHPAANGTEVWLDMVTDAAGNVYVCGYSDGAGTGNDIVVAKYALDGDTLWVYRYNDAQANGQDRAVSIALTNANDVVVAGHTTRTGTAQDCITLVLSGNTGAIQSGWPVFYNGPANGNDYLNDVAVRQSDNLIAVCGAYTANGYLKRYLVTYSILGGSNWVGNQSALDSFDKYNLLCGFYNSGNLVVVDQSEDFSADTISTVFIYNGSNGQPITLSYGAELGYLFPYDYEQSVVRDLYIDGTEAFILVDYTNSTNSDYFAIYQVVEGSLLIPTIDPIYVRQFSTTNARSRALFGNASQLVVAGYEDVDPLTAVNWNAFISGVNRPAWTQAFHTNYGSTTLEERFHDVVLDNNGNIYATGHKTGNNRDIVTCKYNSTGQLQWEIPYNGPSNGLDEAYRIAVGNGTLNGTVWVAGRSTGTADDGIVLKYCTPPVADAGPDKHYCTGNTTTVGTAAVAGSTYLWSPATGLSSSTVANPTVNLTNTTSCPVNHTYIVRVTNANGCTDTDTVQVTVYHVPTVSIVTSSPNTICQGDPAITITPTVNTGCSGTPSYSWRLNGTPVSTSTSPYSVSQVSQSGTYTLQVTNTHPAVSCSTTSNSVTATVNPIPVGSASPQTVCSGIPATVTLNSTIAGTGYFWTAAVTSGTVTGQQDGAGTSIQQTLTGSGQVTYTVSPMVTATGCFGQEFTVVVTVAQAPAQPQVTASGPTTFCSGDNVILSGPSGYTYSWSCSASTLQSVTVTQTSTCTLTISSGTGCSATSLPTTVTVNANPTVSITGINTFCTGSTTTLTANAQPGSGTLSTYAWTLNGQPIGTVGSVHQASLAGTYGVTVTNSNGCTATAQTVSVTESSVPTTAVVIANGPVTFCQGGSVSLTGTAGNCNGCTFTWRRDGVDVGTGTSFLATQSGTYTMVTSNTCGTATSNSVTVAVNPALVANAGADQSICPGESVTLMGSGGTICQWSPTAGLNDPNSCSPIATPTVSTNYILTVTGSIGNCTDADTVVVSVVAAQAPTPQPDWSHVYNGSNVLVEFSLINSAQYDYVEWNFGDGSASSTLFEPIHEFNGFGPFTVSVMACVICAGDTICSIDQFIVSVVGIGEVTQGSALVLSPNPANDVVTVRSSHVVDGIVELMDLNGKVIETIVMQGSVANLKLQTLATGNYTVRLRATTGVYHQRLVIVR